LKPIYLKKLLFVVVMSILVSYYPSSASAVERIGMYPIESYQSRVSGDCQTGYPNIVFDVKKTYGGTGKVTIQRYSSGSWQPLAGTERYLSTYLTYKIPAWSSSTRYRVHITNMNAELLGVNVDCKGSW
jgi:hypothetical protein